MAIPASPSVLCPQGGRLVLAWLVATLAAAIPCAIVLGLDPVKGGGILATVAVMGLVCSPLASAAALALCRSFEKTETLTRDKVMGLFWVTGAGFAVVVPILFEIAMVVMALAEGPGSGQAQGGGWMVLVFLLAWMLATAVGLVVSTPVSAFAGYIVSRAVFRAADDPPEAEVVDGSPEASRP